MIKYILKIDKEAYFKRYNSGSSFLSFLVYQISPSEYRIYKGWGYTSLVEGDLRYAVKELSGVLTKL